MRSLRLPASVLALLLSGLAQASVGLGEIAATPEDGPVTLYYPSTDVEQTIHRGPFTLQVAPQGQPVRGNGRLVVLSHGSGGAPWVHADLARTLVEAGFVVAMPEHRADNYKNGSDPGPDSWTMRPAEVSRAIDAVGRDPRLAPLLQLDKVGVDGMSAGGHPALSLAGGRWSPIVLKGAPRSRSSFHKRRILKRWKAGSEPHDSFDHQNAAERHVFAKRCQAGVGAADSRIGWPRARCG